MKKIEHSSNIDQIEMNLYITIGVTGHRKLHNEYKILKAIHKIIKEIRKKISLKSVPLYFRVLSPLAEGADRLIVKEILKYDKAKLEVVLPLEKDDYIKDFKSKESMLEFEKLLSKDNACTILQPSKTRNEAYEKVGYFVVDCCDILIAIWDGKPSRGQGGTAEIVDYARKIKRPIFWIHTEEPLKFTEENVRSLKSVSIKKLEEYKLEKLNKKDKKEIESIKIREKERLIRNAYNISYIQKILNEFFRNVLPHYAKADQLAIKYQKKHFLAEDIICALAVCATFIVSFQFIFFPDQPIIICLEVLLMIFILLIIGISRRSRLHEKWIDYRFLAERFRILPFLNILQIKPYPLSPPPYLGLSYSTNDWMIIEFESQSNKIPVFRKAPVNLLEDIKKFLLSSWINDQIIFHKRTYKRKKRNYRILFYQGITLFTLTLIISLIHALHTSSPYINKLIVLLAINLPAIGGALGAIRNNRELYKNAERSEVMAQYLENVKEKIKSAENNKKLVELVKEAEETMLHENEDWRVIFRYKSIGSLHF